MQQKEVDDVLGGADAWKNVQATQGELPALPDHCTPALSFEMSMSHSSTPALRC